MDYLKLIAELRSELEQIDQAILTLEHVAAGSGRRRGRPPKWLAAAKAKEAPPEKPDKKRAE
jgi:hypothetical protein